MQGSQFVGAFALLLAALAWGMSFPAQSAAADVVSSFTFIAGKSSVAFLFMAALIAGRHLAKSRRGVGADAGKDSENPVGRSAQLSEAVEAPSGTAVKPAEISEAKTSSAPSATAAAATSKPGFFAAHRRVIVGGILCGLVLFAADNCQQFGITAYPPEAAASGRAGFLTATYVVMVAVCARFMGRKLHPLVVVAVFVCLAGMYLLCVPPGTGFGDIYLGDVVMLFGALFYTFHILAVGRFALEDALWLSCSQFATSATLSWICAVVVEGAVPTDLIPAMLSVLYVGIFSTGLGYTLQNIGQRTVAEAPAAILMSLESVFAALGGWWLLNEQLSTFELAGCALVFAAVLLAQAPSFKREVKDDARSS